MLGSAHDGYKARSVARGLFVRRTLLHRPRRRLPVEVERRVDERDMRERLRKVPELPARRRIPLLREQAQVAAQVEEPLEEGLCLVEPSLQSEVVGEPECARQEGALARREAVD